MTQQQTRQETTADVIAQLAAAIAAAGGGNTVSPIGVPPGYVAPIANPESGGFQPGTGPAIGMHDFREQPYNEGDDWGPASLSPQAIASLQQQMAGAGLLTDAYRIGVWDNASRVAYRGLLGYANSIGTTDEFALRRWTATGMGAVKAPRVPLVAEVSNPDDIKAALRSTFRDKLGHGAIDDGKLNAMVAAYQGTEKQFQQSEYDLAGDGTTGGGGGTVVRPPDISTFADVQAKRTDPVAYDSNKVLEKFHVIRNMLSGGGASNG